MFDDATTPFPATAAGDDAAGSTRAVVAGYGGRDGRAVPDDGSPKTSEEPPDWSSAELKHLAARLAEVDLDVSDVERVDQLRALEHVKSACAAVQARITAKFVDSQSQIAQQWHEQAAASADEGDFEQWRTAREQARRHEWTPPPDDTKGDRTDRASGAGSSAASDGAVSGNSGSSAGSSAASGAPRSTEGGDGPARRRRRTDAPAGVAAQVGLARRESPARGSRLVGQAIALTGHLRHTLAALQAGLLNEYRASLVVNGTSHLSRELAAQVDELVIGANDEAVGTWGNRELEHRVRACADRLDAAAAAERARVAEARRRVTLRPVPDTMAMLSAVLPVAQAVAVHAALARAAAAAITAGDPRTRDQLMADTLVALVTGQEAASDVPIEVQVIISDQSLFNGDDTPAHVPGYGPVPAAWVRHLLIPDDDDEEAGTSVGTSTTSSASEDDAGDGTNRQTGPDATAGPDRTAGASAATQKDDPPTNHTEAADSGEARVDGCPFVPVGEDDGVDAGTGSVASEAKGPGPRPPGHSPASPRPSPPLREPAPWWGQPFTPSAPPDRARRRARTWLRRLYLHPATGTLVGMESRRRLFDAGLRRYLITRDGGTCRTPYCDAPIRHLDHIDRWSDGGPTTAANGQGLSERCNHVKDLPGWQARVIHPGPEAGDDGHPHTVVLTTPTGHSYTTTAPPVLTEYARTPSPGTDARWEQPADPARRRNRDNDGRDNHGSAGLSPFEVALANRLAS